MKKLFPVLSIIAVLVIAFLYAKPEYMDSIESFTDKALPDAVTHSRAYRWKDSKGQWQLSDKPPADGIDYEVVEYHKDTNVIPSERLTGKK